jgi:putative nucleotidyltransferase with HDIG domain
VKTKDKEEVTPTDTAFLISAIMKLVELSAEEDIYQFIGEQLAKLIENSIIVVSSFDENSNSFCVRSVVGEKQKVETYNKVIGKRVIGMTATISDDARQALIRSKLVKVPGGLYKFALGQIPKPVCHTIEHILGLGDIYDMGFAWKGKLFGSTGIFIRKGTELRNLDTVEVFINYASIVLQRRQVEKALQEAHDQLDARVRERTQELTKTNETMRIEIAERKRAEEELRRTAEKLLKSLEGFIQSIAKLVEIRDPYTAGHQQRVTQLACAIAREMHLSEERIRSLRLAGIIHDVGKINVPAEILSKPGSLSEAEFSIIKTHPQVGYEILKNIDSSLPLAQIVHQHHERMDGSGYPLGLVGEDIILEARILAVADVVEAMLSHRPYRPSLGEDAAMQEIKQNRGVLYDARVVDTCLQLFAEKSSFKFD